MMSNKSATTPEMQQMDEALAALSAGGDKWARTSPDERIAVLAQVKDALLSVSKTWARVAARHKQLPEGSPLIGEEWTTGPYALMSACNGLMLTLGRIEGKTFLDPLEKRVTATGRLAVRVVPHSIWDHLFLSGVRAEVWMQEGVTGANLADHTAGAYDIAAHRRKGAVALVLGAGNIAAIAPLDCFQKLFLEHQVVLLKLNPVNDYLAEVLETALKPLIERDALRIVKGGGDVGEYLAGHPRVEELHITGAGATHDAIVWGPGAEGRANKAAGTPRNTRRISSELGAVCPTIVVPGPWTPADIRYQAEHIATQKMHNSGFNCVACQVLVLPRGWDRLDHLMEALKGELARAARPAYYPGTDQRLATFADKADNVMRIKRKTGPAALIVDLNLATDSYYRTTEVFGPALGTYRIAESDPGTYLQKAVDYANDNLYGTLGANILIHPATIRKIGKDRFEEIIGGLHYGAIAINTWTGLGFLLTACPWGAFPGHTKEDVQSGIGFVHNTFMFDRPERCVVQAPWRPFPRSLLSGRLTLLPKPPWFVTHTKQHMLGRFLTRFQHSPGWLKLPRVFLKALFG